jgi:hypothetical protein
LDGSGHASVTEANLSIGTHSLSAAYTGSGSVPDGSSTGTVSLTVAQGSTTTIVANANNPSSLGQNIAFTATVTGSTTTPTGTVTFKADASTLGTSNLSGGVATSPSTTSLSTGTHIITATYNSDTNNATSSGTLSQVVGTGVSATNLTVSSSTAAPGQSVNLTAAVIGASPTGTVTFLDGSTSIGSKSLASGSAVLSTSFSSTGAHSLTASYSGNLAGSVSTPASTINIAKVGSTTSLTSSANAVAAGSPVTLTTVVTGSTDLPSGSVTFFDGGTQVGSPVTLDGSAHASLATSSLPVGSQTITASFSGNGEYNSSSSLALTVNVTNSPGADFTFGTGSGVTGATMGAGQSVTIPVTLQGTSGFSGIVTITCAGLPTGAACTSSPPTVSVNSSGASTANILITTTGAHSGTGSVTMGLIRRAALPVAGIFSLFTFLWRRSRKGAMAVALLATSVLIACGGGGGGSTLPGVGSGNGFGSTGPALPTPTPAAGGSGGTPGAGQGTPSLSNGTGDIVAGTGTVGAISTNTLPAGAVIPNAIAPGTIVAGALTPGTSSGASGNTQGGTYTISLVATGSNGVAHPLPINIVVSP